MSFYGVFQLDSHLLRITRPKWGEFSTPAGDASLLSSLLHTGFHLCVKYKNQIHNYSHFMKNCAPHHCEQQQKQVNILLFTGSEL